ncbi:hypothetical protein [uncultured Legionella sp.]|uniref:hypothetical protein n=1 Tax=uncultured Legionella sp. TaxID=210934 RepID=UPI0026081558|nr:hypothetical protein [uncultured Legionella sp.]
MKNDKDLFLATTSGQLVEPQPFEPDSSAAKPDANIVYAILLMLVLMVVLFSNIKRYWLAWILATVTTPLVGIAFLTLFFDPLYLLYLYAIVFILFATGIVAALMGWCVLLWKRKKNLAIALALVTSLSAFALGLNPQYLSPFLPIINYLSHIWIWGCLIAAYFLFKKNIHRKS